MRESTPRSPETLVTEGWTLWKLGRHDEAVETLTSLPETPEVLEILVLGAARAPKYYDRTALKGHAHRLGLNHIAVANAYVVYELDYLGRKSEPKNGSLITLAEALSFAEGFKSDEAWPAVKRANLLQNVALLAERNSEGVHPNPLRRALQYYQEAAQLYDPNYPNYLTRVEENPEATIPNGIQENAQHAHHIAGLFFRMYALYVKLNRSAEAEQALSNSVKMWNVAIAQNTKPNPQHNEKRDRNLSTLQNLRSK